MRRARRGGPGGRAYRPFPLLDSRILVFERGERVRIGRWPNPRRRRRSRAEARATLDIGAGDPEAPANAIPNIIAQLVETETWRNAATVVMGVLLIGLGYWSYNGIRDAIARDAGRRASRRCSAPSCAGVDVWVGEHRAEAERGSRGDPAWSSGRRAAGAGRAVARGRAADAGALPVGEARRAGRRCCGAAGRAASPRS